MCLSKIHDQRNKMSIGHSETYEGDMACPITFLQSWALVSLQREARHEHFIRNFIVKTNTIPARNNNSQLSKAAGHTGSSLAKRESPTYIILLLIITIRTAIIMLERQREILQDSPRAFLSFTHHCSSRYELQTPLPNTINPEKAAPVEKHHQSKTTLIPRLPS